MATKRKYVSDEVTPQKKAKIDPSGYLLVSKDLYDLVYERRDEYSSLYQMIKDTELATNPALTKILAGRVRNTTFRETIKNFYQAYGIEHPRARVISVGDETESTSGGPRMLQWHTGLLLLRGSDLCKLTGQLKENVQQLVALMVENADDIKVYDFLASNNFELMFCASRMDNVWEIGEYGRVSWVHDRVSSNE